MNGINKLKQEIKRLERENRILKDKIGPVAEKFLVVQSKIPKKINQLKQKNEMLQKKLDSMSVKSRNVRIGPIFDLNIQNEIIFDIPPTNEINELRDAIKKKNKQLRNATKDNVQKKKLIEQKAEQILKMENDQMNYILANQSLKEEIKSLKQENNSLKEENNSLKEKNNKLHDDNKKLKLHISDLEKEIQRLKNIINSIPKYVDPLKRQLIELKSNLEIENDDSKLQSVAIERLKKRVSDLSKDLQDSRIEAQELAKQLASKPATTNNSDNLQELLEIKSEVDQFSIEFANIQKDLEDTAIKDVLIESLKERITELRNENQMLKGNFQNIDYL